MVGLIFVFLMFLLCIYIYKQYVYQVDGFGIVDCCLTSDSGVDV